MSLTFRGRPVSRKSLGELQPDAVALARRLRRKKPKGGQMSLRAISELTAAGYVNERGIDTPKGKRWHPTSVQAAMSLGVSQEGPGRPRAP